MGNLFEINIQSLILAVIIISSVISSIKGSLEDRDYTYSINRVIFYFSIFISLLIVILKAEDIYRLVVRGSLEYFNYIIQRNSLFDITIIGLAFLVIHFIIYLFLNGINKPLEKSRNLFKRIGTFKIVITSTILGFLKGINVVLIIFILISAYNSGVGRNKAYIGFQDYDAFEKIDKIVSTSKPMLNYNNNNFSYLNNVIVYYNGVTLEDGIKSNEDIDNKALEIVNNSKNDREKARKIYTWVGSNIEYDFDKAEKVLDEDSVTNSGAMEAFSTKKGICFDYSCLYTAMAKKVNLKTRILTGDAFDGKNYGPHAWNQVFLEDEDKWINVDATFYLAGDYFDNLDFNDDHLNPQIAGEW
ncbi:transglutaminase-like domain-containing protein [Clostridium sp.]|uniref:transglutaminase-like domain-containing protein n=1 Tax=Clostridium sp. TaxID=1506 RepID=UPI00262FECC3|nr:transglutaminase-like domain-containing protein [Clostridium sp.]